MTGIEAELTTPTGAALISTMASAFNELPSLTIDSIGYGAGERELRERPNILRVFIGKTPSDLEHDQVMVVETNIDNMNPEIVVYAVDKLFSAGAVDVYVTPVAMKKGRIGQQITVLVEEVKLQTVLDILFSETSTLGVRLSKVDRRKLPREITVVITEFGKVGVKLASWNGIIKIAPEFDDCQRIASEQNVSIERVYNEAKKAGEELSRQ